MKCEAASFPPTFRVGSGTQNTLRIICEAESCPPYLLGWGRQPNVNDQKSIGTNTWKYKIWIYYDVGKLVCY